ncbi:MAG: hypothetical protein IIB61_03190, partial [Planctomycetes bacterium]|nr:hypothetical protein [Planctomycetota bacterium]
MKQGTAYAARLAKEFAALRRSLGEPEIGEADDPLRRLAIAVLSAHTTEAKAEKAIDRLRKAQKLKLPDLTAYECKFCSKWHIGTLRRNHMAKPSATPKPKPEPDPKPEDTTKPEPDPTGPAQEAAPHLRFVEMSAALQNIETEAVEFLENEQDIPDTVLLKVSAYL